MLGYCKLPENKLPGLVAYLFPNILALYAPNNPFGVLVCVFAPL